MRQDITFPIDGGSATGHFVAGGGPGIVVIQEFWGLNDHIVDVADRFGDAGFTVIAPDLYDGELAADAQRAMALAGGLDHDRVGKILTGAVDHVRDQAGSDRVGVVGYCLGGGLALWLGTLRPDVVAAIAPYYGLFRWEPAPDWSALQATVVGEYAALDQHVTPEAVEAFAEQLRGLGKDVTMHINEGCEHGFFNDSRPEVYDAEQAITSWDRTLELFRRLEPEATPGT